MAILKESLDHFILPNVTQTGRILGSGSFGSVEVLDMDGLKCAGKIMFPFLVDPRNEGADYMVQKYYRECSLLSSLQHPNIVRFLGICYVNTTHLPVLVMELMEKSLEDLLENTPGIPLEKKILILQDVARGLIHLHERNPVVIHRDLTAKNVLLDSDQRAKIADVGNALIVQSNSRVTASRAPGTQAYMPPEATDATVTKYHTSLDVFSFGHLSLFTITQVFPLPKSATYKHPISGRIMGYTEIERRSNFMKILTDMLTKSHPIVDLITECLDYEPIKRPLATNLLKRLREIGSRIIDDSHAGGGTGVDSVTHGQPLSETPELSASFAKLDLQSYLLKYPWFHGAIQRDEAVRRLQSRGIFDGLYLVRCSPKHPDSFVLTMYARETYLHYRISRVIKPDKVTWYCIGDGPKFSRIDLLLRHYSIKRDGLPIRLSDHCPRLST